jgi:hypothetical protein
MVTLGSNCIEATLHIPSDKHNDQHDEKEIQQ